MSNSKYFYENGFVLIKNVFSKELLIEYYKEFKDYFDTENWKISKLNTFDLTHDIYSVFPNLASVIYTEQFFSAIKEILGNSVVWIPECALHHNRYIDWHKDTTEQTIGGVKSHIDFSFPLLQVAIYFQEDTPLDFIKGSHNQIDEFVSYYKKDLSSRIISKLKKIFKISIFDKLNKHRNCYEVRYELGDLLLFDVRIDHKSKKINNFQGEKFAIFNTFGTDNLVTLDYFNYMKTRKETYYQVFQKYDFSSNLHQLATNFGVTIWA